MLHCPEVWESTIRLLQDFNKDLFMQCHDMALMEEDDRLEELNQITLNWWRRMGRERIWRERSQDHSSQNACTKIGLIHILIDHVTLVKIWLDGFEVSHQGS